MSKIIEKFLLDKTSPKMKDVAWVDSSDPANLKLKFNIDGKWIHENNGQSSFPSVNRKYVVTNKMPLIKGDVHDLAAYIKKNKSNYPDIADVSDSDLDQTFEQLLLQDGPDAKYAWVQADKVSEYRENDMFSFIEDNGKVLEYRYKEIFTSTHAEGYGNLNIYNNIYPDTGESVLIMVHYDLSIFGVHRIYGNCGKLVGCYGKAELSIDGALRIKYPEENEIVTNPNDSEGAKSLLDNYGITINDVKDILDGKYEYLAVKTNEIDENIQIVKVDNISIIFDSTNMMLFKVVNIKIDGNEFGDSGFKLTIGLYESGSESEIIVKKTNYD